MLVAGPYKHLKWYRAINQIYSRKQNSMPIHRLYLLKVEMENSKRSSVMN